MAEKNLFSKDRHEWQAVNRRAKKVPGLKSAINTSVTVTTEYGLLIEMFEQWRVEVFANADTFNIVGNPAAIFPCTYQEWSGNIPFDTYVPGAVAGTKKPVWKPVLAEQAAKFRKAVSQVIHSYDAAANINRIQPANMNPGEGVNA